ncbi:UMS binding protein [Mycena maculata]|uniref:UMS binding protein n=1 Tax=Mycena maculata TaxID=230809 RepID=A0AAD7P044_9AGAR|nr:UMS binding protein [Mycena maculata]
MEQTLKTCYKCGREGHLSYTCPQNAALHGGSHFTDTSPATKKCYKCSGVGHIARECPKETRCYNCREMGHISRECPHPQKCHRCGKEGLVRPIPFYADTSK